MCYRQYEKDYLKYPTIPVAQKLTIKITSPGYNRVIFSKAIIISLQRALYSIIQK